MIQHESNDDQMVYTIYFYQNMQNQVSPIHQTQENGKKAHFWLFGSFKNDVSWFLNDPACSPNVSKHSFLSNYAISS